ncbi:cell division cycle and apoptosis regulator 1 [Musa troglodytarum]|uniref:Cell division cycle and apoptosis regulator 1 n=1 Tax=Musa troglodytarum TaxID=320322 RepID=A0A9E7EK05_9LILI|nr:cell division cycle and apoptosis regulator 1 [Musa troglodytarum]
MATLGFIKDCSGPLPFPKPLLAPSPHPPFLIFPAAFRLLRRLIGSSPCRSLPRDQNLCLKQDCFAARGRKMYPSKGNNPYGQQPYGSSQAYGHIPGGGYTGNPVGGSDTDMNSYRAYSSQAPQYGGPYASVYGSSGLSNVQQVGGVSGKEAVPSALQGRSAYPSVLVESSKFSSATLGSSMGITTDDYVSATNRAYSQKGDQFSAIKNPDYALTDRRHYGEHQGAFVGRELQSDSARRYLDSVSLSNRHQAELHDQMDQASLLRQQQMLKAQPLQSGSDMRQDEYFAARTVPSHHGSQEISSYGARTDADPRGLSVYGATSYGGQVAASILGGAPRRNVDDLMYVQGSSNAAYGVGLPPGRDYAAGKGILGPPHESNYQANVLSRTHPTLGVSMVDERNDDRNAYRRELEIREEERRRELMREREKERERDREREREREREHERERERERLRERRDKERERDRKHGPDSRRERTPPRTTRDRRGSSLIKDEKAVYPFCLVDVERDYLSLSKRYPRLAIAPDFSKAIMNWPRETLNLSLYTPVSFEHDFLDIEDKSEEKGSVLLDEPLKPKGVKTLWNTKVILMSGISCEALNELCLEKDTDERIVHFNNILKFAVLKKDRSFLAIGGPSHVTLDGDPQLNDSSLIQTAIRHVKHATQLDLHNCLHWNRFLEIHYNRVGKDGLFSHKEVTVLFVPNLSECLPSVDLWQSQWLAHKKEIAERERQLALKQEKKSGEKKEADKGDNSHGKTVNDSPAKSLKGEDYLVKDDMDDIKTDYQTKDEVDGSKKIVAEDEGKGPLLDDQQTEHKDDALVVGECKTNEKLVHDEGSLELGTEIKKTTKKKIVKKVVKGKTVAKKVIVTTVQDTCAKQDEKMDMSDDKTEYKDGNASQEGENLGDPLNPKTCVEKKIVTKVAVSNSPQKEETANSSEFQTDMKLDDESVPKEEAKKEQGGDTIVQDAEIKTTGKKKVIRRVIKRKVPATKVKDANSSKDAEETKVKQVKDHSGKKELDVAEGIFSENKIMEESNAPSVEKVDLNEKTVTNEKLEKKETSTVDSHSTVEKGGSKSINDSEETMQKESKEGGEDGKKERKKDEREKSKGVKHEPNPKSHKEKEKGGSREHPMHPGLILQTHRVKGSKLRSMSLSLGGLLDYNDKDIEECTFELSLFAESFNEMLQFEMGCRLLSFLEKLRERYVVKRNNRKRQRDDKSEKGTVKEKSPVKRPKTSDGSQVSKSTRPGKEDISSKISDEGMSVISESVKLEKEGGSDRTNDEHKGGDDTAAGLGEIKMEEKTVDDDMVDDDEDPEEIIEEEADDDAGSNRVGEASDVKADTTEAEPEIAMSKDDDSKPTSESGTDKVAIVNEKSDKEEDKQIVEEKKDSTKDEKDSVEDENKDSSKDVNEVHVKDAVVDKQLLQAFRFFDQNRVGYIKVQDLRCILHNLGKFLSHRDVKELAQSALLESNSARDDRIFYKKLVRLTFADR